MRNSSGTAESAAYIRSRPDRYPGGQAIEPEWTQEALDDVDLVAFEPDPKSRMGASRFIGRSAAAGRVLVVIASGTLMGTFTASMPGRPLGPT